MVLRVRRGGDMDTFLGDIAGVGLLAYGRGAGSASLNPTFMVFR